MDPRYSAATPLPASYPGTAGTGYPVSSTTQNYYPGAPQVQEYIPNKPRVLVPWSTGLCDCCSDVENCCITWFCPCITFGQISEIVDRGSCSCGLNCCLYCLIAYVSGCPCLYSCCYRSKLREQYSIEGNPCSDCCVHCFCEACALCQEYRELKHHGFDMHLGWQGNMERRNRGVPMAPLVEGGMYR